MSNRLSAENQRQKSILFLTQFFYPDVQATSQIFTDLCEDLAETYQVKVVCGAPLIAVKKAKKSTIQATESFSKIDIMRVFSARQEKSSFLNRAINHISFILSAFIYIFFTKRSDMLIYTSDNPLSFLGTLSYLGKPKIYLCQDLYL